MRMHRETAHKQTGQRPSSEKEKISVTAKRLSAYPPPVFAPVPSEFLLAYIFYELKLKKSCSHQMSYFKAKMCQNRFLLELLPRPRWWSLQHFRRPLSWI